MKFYIKDEKRNEVAVLEGDYLFAVVGTEEQTESVLLGKTSPKILSRNGAKEIVKQCRTISINDNQDFALSILSSLISFLINEFNKISKEYGYTYDEIHML